MPHFLQRHNGRPSFSAGIPSYDMMIVFIFFRLKGGWRLEVALDFGLPECVLYRLSRKIGDALIFTGRDETVDLDAGGLGDAKVQTLIH